MYQIKKYFLPSDEKKDLKRRPGVVWQHKWKRACGNERAFSTFIEECKKETI